MNGVTQRRPAVDVGDEAQVRDLLARLMAGWNAGSGEGFAAPFAEDGEQVAFDGTRFRGRDEIASSHQQLFDRFLKGSRLVGRVTDVKFLTPGVAVAHAIGGTVMPGETDIDPERNSVQTLVAVKLDGEWRIAAFHNSRAQFMGRAEKVAEFTAELRRLL